VSSSSVSESPIGVVHDGHDEEREHERTREAADHDHREARTNGRARLQGEGEGNIPVIMAAVVIDATVSS
jgi:hypothetical protein